MQFVGEAVRDHMLQSGNYEQKLVAIGIAVLGRLANSEAIKKESLSIDKVEEVRHLWYTVDEALSEFVFFYQTQPETMSEIFTMRQKVI